MSSAAQTYARNSKTTASPREIEAQALLKAARQLQDVVENWRGPDSRLTSAILFNRKLWSIFMTDASHLRSVPWRTLEQWSALTASAPHTAGRIGSGTAVAEPSLYSASSQRYGSTKP